MDKFTQTFKDLGEQNKLAFMPFLVAGFPNFSLSLKVALYLAKTSDLLEIGFPYSDPLADGPVIQAADSLALKNGITTKLAFKFVSEIRKNSKIPITVLVYANVVYQQGIKSFYSQAKEAGIDGVLVPDVPMEEAGPFVKAAKKSGILPIFLITQTTNSERLKKILKYAKGYLYVVTVLGVTGARKQIGNNIIEMIHGIKLKTGLPLAAGFGISNNRQVKILKKAGVNGVIIGSALVEIVEKYQNNRKLFTKLAAFKNSILK